MPYTTPVASYSATLNGTYTAINGIQAVLIERGRQRFQDNFPQTICSIELIPDATYTLPFAIGQFLDVRTSNSASAPAYFVGVITDVQRNYSMPYNSVTGSAPGDRITLIATGTVGSLGKNSLANYNVLGPLATGEVFSLASSVGIYCGIIEASPVTISTQTYTGGALDLANQLLRTSQYMIDDIDNVRVSTRGTYTSVIFSPGQGNQAYTFSDAGTVGAYKFTELEYLSSVETSFTQVQVEADGLAIQTASSGSAPYNTLVYDTLNASTADALSLANYVLATQSLASVTPYSITTNTNVAASCTDISKLSTTDIFSAGGNKAMNLGAAVTIVFRETTVLAQIQGISTAFYPDYAQVRLYLSPNLGTPFTLDSAAFGVLDSNRLGYP